MYLHNHTEGVSLAQVDQQQPTFVVEDNFCLITHIV